VFLRGQFPAPVFLISPIHFGSLKTTFGLFPDVIVAISGTPGTGKSTLASILRGKGSFVIDVGDFARDRGLTTGHDVERGSVEVDTAELDIELRKGMPSGTIFLIGHLSHFLTSDLVIILRCSPSALRERLKDRTWSDKKLQENLEAEACDVILIEALELSREVYEIDTTGRTPEEVAMAVDDILAGKREKYAYGNIDWSGEVLNWF
jgi:adenylate kinase